MTTRSVPEEMDALLDGRASLSVNKNGRTQKQPIPTRPSPDLAQIRARLQEYRSREEGVSLLSEAQLTRRDLELLARQLGLPILRSDTIERLESKIIESCIGAKLTSEAIRGPQKMRG